MNINSNMGARITSLSALKKACIQRKAVTTAARWRVLPAAVVFFMTGPVIDSLISEGLFVYRKNKKHQ